MGISLIPAVSAKPNPYKMEAIPVQYSLLLILAMVTNPITGRATQATFQGSRQSCHEEGINYQGRKGSSVIPGVTSWTECSALCDTKPNCNSWSWVKEDTGIYALNCALMEGFSNRAPDTNTITGPKGCKDTFHSSSSTSAALSLPGGCQQYWYNWFNKCQDRSGSSVVPEAKSWQECWNAWTKRRGCQAWTYAFQCVLVGSFPDEDGSTTTTTTTTTSTTSTDTNTITTTEDTTSSNNNPEWTLVNPSERLYFDK